MVNTVVAVKRDCCLVFDLNPIIVDLDCVKIEVDENKSSNVSNEIEAYDSIMMDCHDFRKMIKKH